MSTLQVCWLKETTELNNILEQMLSASDYWQPDAESQWCALEHGIGLSKAQLYNTQYSKEEKVYYDENLKLAITANARLDNRNKLLKQLNLESNTNTIISDSEIILQSYTKWGRECTTYLRGDFVFVIWDELQQKLFCARDHFGVKVLFYSQNKKGTMITNEHNAFFTSNWCDKNNIDEEWLVKNIWDLGPQNFDSPNPDIKILPPAHTLEIDKYGIKLKQYWHLKAKPDWQHLDDESLINELKVRFNRAVVSRLDSLYPLGTELSEGIDSNGIAGFAAQSIEPQKLYTFSFECEALNDKNQKIWASTYKEIEDMLAMYNNLHPVWTKSIPANKKKLLDEKRKQNFYQNFGGVIPRLGIESRLLLAKEKGCRVLLSGWGGDHCVTSHGYEHTYELLRSGKIITLYQLLRARYTQQRGYHPIRAMIPIIIHQCLPRSSFYLKICFPSTERSIQQKAKNHFLDEKWRSLFHLDTMLKHFLRKYQRLSVREYELRELLEQSLTNRLIKSELTSRQHRLEYRFPMLDVDLVEFAHSLPSHLKLHQGIERYAFRRILENITTKRIQWRRKADVNIPNNLINKKANTNKLQQYWNNHLIKRYCNNNLKKDAQLTLHNKSMFQFILNIENFYQLGNHNLKGTVTTQNNIK